MKDMTKREEGVKHPILPSYATDYSPNSTNNNKKYVIFSDRGKESAVKIEQTVL